MPQFPSPDVRCWRRHLDANTPLDNALWRDKGIEFVSWISFSKAYVPSFPSSSAQLASF